MSFVSDDTDKYDFFVSYACADNKDEEGRPVICFLSQLEAAHERLFGHKPKFFSDKTDIGFGRDWNYILHYGMAASRLFLAFVSPRYLDSDVCRREWRAWIDAEIGKGIFGQGIRPVFIAHVDGCTTETKDKSNDRQIAEKVARLCKQPVSGDDYIASVSTMIKELRRRNCVDVTPFLPFFSEGVDGLRRNEMRGELEQLARNLVQPARLVAAATASSKSNVPPYNRYFSGRLDELNQLRDRLRGERIVMMTGAHGLGGIGKTELAFTYAQAFAFHYPGGRFYVSCEHARSLRQAVLSLDRDVDEIRADISDEERKHPDALFAAVQRSLRNRLARKGNILLVLDNVTDAKLVLPEQTNGLTGLASNLHLLFTTRLAPLPDSGKWLTVDELPEADALALLEKYRPLANDTDRTAAQRIVRRLGGLTLAVELIAAYLADTPETGYAALADELGQDDPGDDLEMADAEEHVALRRYNHERRLTDVLALTLRDLRLPERRALEYAALLPPERVVLPWLRELVGRDFSEALKPTDLVADPWHGLLERLFKRALLRPGQDDAADELKVVRMHRLLQETLLRHQTDNDRAVWQWTLDKLVEERFSAVREGAMSGATRCEVQSLAALAQLWADRQYLQAEWLLDATAWKWHDLAVYSEAEPLYRRALAVAEASHGPLHPDVARKMNSLAGLLEDTQRLQEAESLYRRALEINEASYDPPHPNVAASLNSLAQLLWVTNRPQEAEPLYRCALEISEAIYSPWHPSVAVSLNNLAQLLPQVNRLQEAERLMKRALAINETNYGPRHPNVARDLSSLAGVLQATDRPGEAEPLYRRALAIDEAIYGPQHPAVAIRLNNLGQLLRAAKRTKEAQPLFRRALGIAETALGAEHPTTLTLRNNLADAIRFSRKIFMLGLLWTCLIGIVAGVIAKWFMPPGQQPMEWWMAGALGIVGSFVGGFVARLLIKPAAGSPTHPVGILLSIVGAAIVLFLYPYL